MNCAEARRGIDILLDGELLPQEACTLKGHLEACRECAALYVGEEKLRAELKEQLRGVRASHGLRDRVTRATGQASAPLRTRSLRWTLAAVALFGIAFLVFLFLPVPESPQALASEMTRRHEATREGYCSASRSDSVCVCPRCGHDVEKTLRSFFKKHVAYDPCLHDLSPIDYEFMGAAVWNHRGKLVCWTTQRDTQGRTISHGLVSTPVAMEGKSAILKVDGRTVLFVPGGRPGMT